MDEDTVVEAPGAGSTHHRSRRRQRGKRDVFQGQASWLSSVVNLVNTIIGAGVLAMPLAMSHMGIVLGICVIIWSGMTAGFGLYLQARCARYLDRGSASFFALSQITYPNASVIFDAAIAIKCFGVGVSYLIIIGDLMPGVVEGFGGSNSTHGFLMDRHFWITAFMLIVIPLSFLRRLDSLKYTSIVALVSIGYLVILVVYHFSEGDTMSDRGPIRVIHWAGVVPALSSFPVIVFAYTCHQNMFSILNEIKDNSDFQTTSVAFASIGGAACIYILVAIAGYLSFGNSIGGNIVGMYAPSVSSTIGRAAIVVLVMFSYPLQIHPCRASVDAILKWRWKSNPTFGNESSPNRHPLLPMITRRPPEPIGDVRFAAITTVIIVLSFITAITVSSLEAVLAYVGSTGSTSISFILPGLFYYKISSPESALHQQHLKEDDDEEADDAYSDDGHNSGGAGGNSDEQQNQSLLSGSGILSSSGFLGNSTKVWRRELLRRLSLALTIYGIVVMIVCLIMNTFFHASK